MADAPLVADSPAALGSIQSGPPQLPLHQQPLSQQPPTPCRTPLPELQLSIFSAPTAIAATPTVDRTTADLPIADVPNANVHTANVHTADDPQPRLIPARILIVLSSERSFSLAYWPLGDKSLGSWSLVSCLGLLVLAGVSPAQADPAAPELPVATGLAHASKLADAPEPAATTAAPGPSLPDPAPAPGVLAAAQPKPIGPWASTFELYGFLPLRTETGLEIGQRSTSFDVGLGTLLSKLKWASSARGSVEYGRLGLLGDVRYDRLGAINSRTGPRGLVGLKTQTSFNATVADLALRYRFGSRESARGKAGDFSIIPYAGVRVIDTNFGVTATVNVLRFERQFSRDLSHTWVQALLGTQATVFLAPRLRLFGRADVGGYGSGKSEKLSGNAQLGLGYALGHNTDLNISWRYQGMDWNNGQSGRNQRGISFDQNGVEIGLKFFF